jgi:quercetin dioxygenase-like cupin family protein
MSESSRILSEKIISARAREEVITFGGVELQTFVSSKCGATRFSTGIARFQPSATLPYHIHSFSEAVTVIDGSARVFIEGRTYHLGPRDCVHVPSGIAHQVQNEDKAKPLLVHTAFGTASPVRTLTDRTFAIDDRGNGDPSEKDPETIIRCQNVYELSQGAFFCDLFARRFGAVGICGGYGRFLPGSSLPCHTHDFDESITIVQGLADCLVQGKKYQLSDCDTAFVPKGKPHRFVNNSQEEMAMIWVYAGDEPDRQIVDAGYCSGELVWPSAAE